MYILKTLYFYEVYYKTRLYSVVELQRLGTIGLFQQPNSVVTGCTRL